MVLFKATKSKRFWAFVIDSMIISFVSGLLYDIILVIWGLDKNALDYAYNQFLAVYEQYLLQMSTDIQPLIDSLVGYIQLAMAYIPVNIFSILLTGFVYLVIIGHVWDKQTVGRLCMKIKVVTKDGSKPSFARLLLREVVGYLLLFEVIGTFDLLLVTFVLVNVEGRSLTDFIGGTEVIVSSMPNNYSSYQDNYSSNQVKKDDNDIFNVEDVTEDDEYKVV